MFAARRALVWVPHANQLEWFRGRLNFCSWPQLEFDMLLYGPTRRVYLEQIVRLYELDYVPAGCRSASARLAWRVARSMTIAKGYASIIFARSLYGPKRMFASRLRVTRPNCIRKRKHVGQKVSKILQKKRKKKNTSLINWAQSACLHFCMQIQLRSCAAAWLEFRVQLGIFSLQFISCSHCDFHPHFSLSHIDTPRQRTHGTLHFLADWLPSFRAELQCTLHSPFPFQLRCHSSSSSHLFSLIEVRKSIWSFDFPKPRKI